MSAVSHLTPYDRFGDALLRSTGEVIRNGQVRCPAHDDSSPSLSVTAGRDGRVLVRCHAGCEFANIVAAVGLVPSDLYPPRRDDQVREAEVTYDYVDESNELLFQVVRKPGKRFLQRRPDGRGGWTYKLGDTRRVLYRLPAVLAAVEDGGTVYIAEGEKDVHALERAGLVATCNPAGAEKWKPEYTPVLSGADVVIVADRDKPGRAHARQVLTSLTGVATSVRVVEAATGKDAADHLGAGLTVDEFEPIDVTDDDRRTANQAKEGKEAPQGPSSPSSANSPNSPFAIPERPWPKLDPEMLYGLAGDAVRLIEPFTEADPVVVYATLLAELGCMIGPGPHVRAGHVDHPARLNVIAVGKTAKARKGTSAAAAGIFTKKVDPAFMATRVLGGFGSGEALVDEVRDPVPSDDPDVPDDPGAADARLLIREGEFASVLSVCTRESSTLSQHIRNAWDGVRLETRSRTRKSVSSKHHVCVVGHITAEELRKGLNAVESLNGFANRMLFVCAKRARLLPFDDEPDPEDVAKLVDALAQRVEAARHVGRVQFAQDARPVWERLYHEMDEDCAGGMLGAITARSEPYTLRIALLLALLDGERLIGVDHLEAAYALWNYCRNSAAYIWGDAIGDENADKLLAALRKAGPDGLDATAQSAVFSRKLNAKKLAAAREELERRGLIQTWEVPTDGRPRIVSRAVAKHATGTAKSESSERSEGTTGGTSE